MKPVRSDNAPKKALIDPSKSERTALYAQIKSLKDKVEELNSLNSSLNKEFEKFSYSVTHDLWAPLRAISGFSQILSRRHNESLNEEGKEYLKYIVDSTFQMEALINGLLDLSRLGRKQVQYSSVQTSELVKDLLEKFKKELDESGAVLQIQETFPVIVTDVIILKTILANLLNNAILYRRQGVAPVIDLSFDLQPETLLIKVTDNGVGIPREFSEKIFDIFQRLQNEDEFKSIGIGLALVRKAVEKLNGKVWMESTLGSGSTFFVQIPN
jgi:light-regulated signal transduction histidine kinase (bacteriophytochrome)